MMEGSPVRWFAVVVTFLAHIFVRTVEAGDDCVCQVRSPHYRTYDGQKIKFFGPCTYTLTKSTIGDDACAFDIWAKNQRWSGDTNATFTRDVFITFSGQQIKMTKRVFVYLVVDGNKFVRELLPIRKVIKNATVMRHGLGIIFESVTCGIKVWFDGDHFIEISVNKNKFQQKMTGICGNCDGNLKNDLTTSKGTDVSQSAKRDSTIGESYLVYTDFDDTASCEGVDVDVDTVCDSTWIVTSSKHDYCGKLNPTRSPFLQCLYLGKVDYRTMFNDCKLDVCIHRPDGTKAKDYVCTYLQQMARECGEKTNLFPTWRLFRFCNYKCAGAKVAYKPKTLTCPISCQNKVSSCNKYSEGCECLYGTIRDETSGLCVTKQNCPCKDAHGVFHQTREYWLGSNCQEENLCKLVHGTGNIIEKTTNFKGCHINAKCEIYRGVRSRCKCQSPLEGDGVHYCDPPQKRLECVMTYDGKNYRGTQRTTILGHRCQPWARQWPHKHLLKDSQMLEKNLWKAEDYCRNPLMSGTIKPKPWCYTLQFSPVWSYCKIRHCNEPLPGYEIPNENCKTNSVGRNYHGTWNTANGVECERWDKVAVKINLLNMPDDTLSEAANYCRNPNNLAGGPYCYSKGTTKWSFCPVFQCTSVTNCKDDDSPSACRQLKKIGKCSENAVARGCQATCSMCKGCFDLKHISNCLSWRSLDLCNTRTKMYCHYTCGVCRKIECTLNKYCAQNAYCDHDTDKCRCNRGFYGDGLKKCEPSCRCHLTGESHYQTYDGVPITFYGACRYTLTKSTIGDDTCAFNVEVKNNQRSGHVLTRLVDIWFKGIHIRLDHGRHVFINGSSVAASLPSEVVPGAVIRTEGNLVVFLAHKCGIRVSFDGSHYVDVDVPKTYANKLTGICGNCNGNDNDDLRTKDGTSVIGKANKFSRIGDSYIAEDRKNINCLSKDKIVVCPSEFATKVKGAAFCGYINTATGPFGACIRSKKVDTDGLYNNCVIDVCDIMPNDTDKTIVCNFLTALNDQCIKHGFYSNWRRANFCPMECKTNAIYKYRMKGCLSSCQNIYRSKYCSMPDIEGCECKPSYYLKDIGGQECVASTMCGCMDNLHYYHPANEFWVDYTCQKEYVCPTTKNSPIRMNKFEHCHENANCVERANGQADCICNAGFQGNGRYFCEKKHAEPPRMNCRETKKKKVPTATLR